MSATAARISVRVEDSGQPGHGLYDSRIMECSISPTIRRAAA